MIHNVNKRKQGEHACIKHPEYKAYMRPEGECVICWNAFGEGIFNRRKTINERGSIQYKKDKCPVCGTEDKIIFRKSDTFKGMCGNCLEVFDYADHVACDLSEIRKDMRDNDVPLINNNRIRDEENLVGSTKSERQPKDIGFRY